MLKKGHVAFFARFLVWGMRMQPCPPLLRMLISLISCLINGALGHILS